MIAILWEFRVLPAARERFERAYGPEGDWVRLFRQAGGYLGTELLRDTTDPCRYLTIDRWETAAAFTDFRQRFALQYEETDR